jgi:pyruvate/2-oxoglutarate dehydrogenase complex dihydrolipoamide acyltransferase (E2) component
MNKFFEVNRRLVESEIKTKYTVSFGKLIDATNIKKKRVFNQKDIKPTYTSFIIKSVGLALREFPYTNRRIYRRFFFHRIQQFKDFDVAIAIEKNIARSEATAFIDVVREVDKMDVFQITESLKNLSSEDNPKWLDFQKVVNKFPVWLSMFIIQIPWYLPKFWEKWRGGAVLVSSPAKYGVDFIIGTWPYPIGISFGLVEDRPLVKNGKLEVCPTFYLTMSFDRRIMAGAQAGRFFNRIVELLETY